MKKVIFLMGPSGCGKSTLAYKLKQEAINKNLTCEIVSADNYFIKDNNYDWDGKFLQFAHKWCQGLFFKLMFDSVEVIIVDNTFLKDWTFYPYIEACNVFGYEWEIQTPKTQWLKDSKVLAEKNIHNVPQSTIENMLKELKTPKEMEKILRQKFEKVEKNA